jgi:hypothetical protein
MSFSVSGCQVGYYKENFHVWIHSEWKLSWCHLCIIDCHTTVGSISVGRPTCRRPPRHPRLLSALCDTAHRRTGRVFDNDVHTSQFLKMSCLRPIPVTHC